MKGKAICGWAALALAAVAAVAALAASESSEKSHKLTSISPRKMADSLHAVIAADREVYARVLAELAASGKPGLQASAEWQREQCLPVPAQMLRMASVSIQRKGAEFSYTLRSLWPIQPRHGPQTAIEEKGLAEVAAHPEQNFYAEETLGGRSYFTAVYPDRAVLPACVSCHNAHPDSPKRDFKLNEVMGAIVVRIPLEF